MDLRASRALRSEMLDGLEDRKVLEVIDARVGVEGIVGRRPVAGEIDAEAVVMDGVAAHRVVRALPDIDAPAEVVSDVVRARPARCGGADDVGRGPGRPQFDPVSAVRERRDSGVVDADGVALDRHALREQVHADPVARDEVPLARAGPADDESGTASLDAGAAVTERRGPVHVGADEVRLDRDVEGGLDEDPLDQVPGDQVPSSRSADQHSGCSRPAQQADAGARSVTATVPVTSVPT